ncbi:general secretion pathway protein GspB [Noviherbaspirillum saxi]|uniref:Type II secretion system protein GspB C-terminal domain-containing protein n=1 Tax=Noviherbaspirillum saxi TaxID=2320863 RepID=A0A3A3GEJ6_9BURK|nr:general secretion pathway protein GspB [Noviherbaspirillum saxi]RJF99329.1 hypothetical protein D3871_12960 [Noviherbaspirillum saxi]
MSYILEALKKAESERNGSAHRTAPLPPLAAASHNHPAWRRALPWAAVAALTVSLAGAAWLTVNRNDAGKATVKPAPVQPGPSPAPETVPPIAAVPAPPVAAEPEQPKEKPAPKKPAEKKRAVAAEEPKAAKAPEPAIGTLQDLPDTIRREIPPLTVGGYIYSGNKADRSVLINKRLLREGDEAAPGLVLEKMTPSGMVLNYKGYRYRRGY